MCKAHSTSWASLERLVSAHSNACSRMAPHPCVSSACCMTSMGGALHAPLKPCSAPVQIADFGMSRVLAHNKSHVSTDTHGTLTSATSSVSRWWRDVTELADFSSQHALSHVIPWSREGGITHRLGSHVC